MLDELARPVPILGPLPGVLTGPRPPEKRASQGDGEPGGDDVRRQRGFVRFREHSRQLASRMGTVGIERRNGSAKLVPVSTPILLGGLTEGASKVARDLLEPMGLDPA